MSDQKKIDEPGKDEISLEQIMERSRSIFGYLRIKWKIILWGAAIGAIAGLLISLFKPVTYSADVTFVLEEGEKSELGQYSGLASLAGINLGTAGGLFEGDNILQLYTSHLMIEKTLLSTANFNGKNELLIDRYIEFNHLREKWEGKGNLSGIQFKGDPDSFNRQQDSIINNLVKTFDKKYLNVGKPDKKLSIIAINVTSKDELFAQIFAEKIVDNVNTFYIQTKTKKSFQNVQVLQHQADSVKERLNSSISGVASAIDAAPNANPMELTLKVPSQKKQVDVQASTAVYAEIVKNLELAKITLRRETPLIQLIDTPVLPLENNKITKAKGTAIGFIAAAFLTSLWVLISNLSKKFQNAGKK